MSTSKAGADSDNGRAVDDAPPHAPEQLPDVPPVEGGASGSGGAGGCVDTPSGQVDDTPQPDSGTLDKAPLRESNPARDDTLPGAETDRGPPPAAGVDLSTIDDPAATAEAFASVGQLLVTQQVISAATAKYIFQGELNLARSDSAAAAAAHPHCPGDVPPTRFGVKQDPSSFIVGVPATSSDRLAERFMRDGYGGLETLAFVETLSDEGIQDLSEMVNPRLSIRPDLLLPKSVEATATVPEFRDLLSSMSARRELASLLQHYPVEGLARKVFKMSTLLKQTLVQLREAKRQLQSSGSRDGSELLDKLSEISAMKTGFALLNQHWKEAFLVCKRQLDRELSDHARDFKRAAQNHEQGEEALRSRLASMTQERDDMFAFARGLDRRLKAGSINVPKVMNFLNQHQTQVVGNWPRLNALLEHLKDHQVPPDNWTTQIMVTAIDDYSAQPGAFVALDEDDLGEEKKEEGGSGSGSGSKNAPLDFTQDPTPPSTPQTPPNKRNKAPSASSRKLQLRPDPYTPSDKDALDPRTSLTRTVEEARASLADHAVIWDKQRTDLQLVMRSGLDDLDAFELVNGDHLVHPRIPVRELTLMLARMMYWGRLNHTPWAKYVPSWCFKKAESYLENLDGAPARWPTLKKLRLDDSAEVMEALFSGVGESEDDEDRDVTFKSSVEFKPQAPRTTPPREAKRRRGSVSSVSSSSAPTGTDPPSEPPAKRHRPAQDRRRSVLARKEYSELVPDELALIETPGRGVMSWRQYGILLKFAPGTANAIEQTTGFPDYAPNLSKVTELEGIRARWDPPLFKVLWDSAPWDDMFQQRLKFLILHSVDDLSARAKSDLVDIVAFMWTHRRTF
ncbi:hypothetical protein PR001_g28308 [Phytophthora rubi]|uniref:Uncharacterized protein n=4 Tax=Phytophthora rubi TaxID=129364 RepID=A0A6A3HA58_9STRA|nr:hypothetical protein PR001_g28308 [Phytophthora rubi]